VNPYAFFVGCPRSGTSLLRRIGDAHAELAIIPETRWIVDPWEKRIGLTREGHITPALLEHLRGKPRFAKFSIEHAVVNGLLAGEDRRVTYGEFVTALFDIYGDRRNKQLVGDKTPRYVRSIPTLSELWPQARFVHLLRDGRDVCLSVLAWGKGASNFSTWEEDTVSTTALWWEWQVRLGREAGAALGRDRYHEVRYESLVADPEAECAKLCAFLGLAYDPEMPRFHEGRTRSQPGLTAKKAWLPVTAGLRRWRDQMAPGDVARFEAAAGSLLDELGYPRGADSASGKEVERASRLRGAFADDVRSRRRTVPEVWKRMVA
jgi:hypothetical protein